MFDPAFTGSGASAFEMVRTGRDDTVVVIAVPETGVVSLLPILRVELVITVPFASGLATCTTSCTEPEPPAATAPMFQVTTPAARAPPAVAETNVVFAGTVSVITPVSVSVTVSVSPVVGLFTVTVNVCAVAGLVLRSASVTVMAIACVGRMVADAPGAPVTQVVVTVVVAVTVALPPDAVKAS